MVTIIKKGEFIEVEYTGKLKDNNKVFDTTSEKIAKDSGIFNPGVNYGPVVICVGQGHLLKGLDNEVVGKEIGKDLHTEIKPEDAFGKKEAKLLKIVPTNIFKKQNINPAPGMQINIDGLFGIIKTVSGGRSVVDFNHPFSSKEVLYDYKINRIVTDDKEKISSYLILSLNCKPEGFSIDIKDKKATVILKAGVNLDDNAKQDLELKFKDMIPDLNVEFRDE